MNDTTEKKQDAVIIPKKALYGIVPTMPIFGILRIGAKKYVWILYFVPSKNPLPINTPQLIPIINKISGPISPFDSKYVYEKRYT